MQNVLAVVNSPAFIAGAGFLLTFLLARHPLHALATLLHARAANEQAVAPTQSRIEDEVSVIADQLDSFLADNDKDVHDLVDPALRTAAEAHLELAAKAKAKSVIDMALTRTGTVTTLLLLCIGLSFASCAHQSALVITGETLDVGAKTAIATSHAMDDARRASTVDGPTYAKWGTFLKVFIATYDTASDMWRTAVTNQNDALAQTIAAVLGTLLKQLGAFTVLVLPDLVPIGGGT